VDHENLAAPEKGRRIRVRGVATVRSSRRSISLIAVVGALMVLSSIGLSHMVGRRAPAERVIVIPAGTAERLAAGEDVSLIPDDLRFHLRDRLVLVNHDVTTHRVGPFAVAPGERVEKRLSEAATIEGFCSLHASGRITIEVDRT
jgi:hypothetical protein